MIELPTPYLIYKASSSPWLGKVPEHWNVCAVKRNYRIQLGKMLQTVPRTLNDVEVPYLRAANVQWFFVQTANPHSMWANPRETKTFGIQKGDLLICEGGEGGRSGIVSTDDDGYIIQNALHRIRPKALGTNQYLQYVMFAATAYGWFDALNDKATIAHLTREKLAAFRIPLPTLSEQHAIVRYLDHVDLRISRYIDAKQKLIDLLEEERQVIINQAVTRGLDPNVRLKPSGVEWLGDVPEHWEMQRLKKISDIQTGITLGKNYGDEKLIERPYLRVANVQSGRLDLSRVTTVRVPPAEIRRATLTAGDVLMTEGGDIDKLGRGCIWPGEIPGCLHQNHIFAVRPKLTVLNPAFLVAVMGSCHGRIYFEVTAKRTTNLATTNRTTLGTFPMYLPGVIEQQAILDHIAEQSGLKDAIIARARRQMELLQEYRTRLISDVVTGKLDVREAAAQLPDKGDDGHDPIEEKGPMLDNMDEDSYNASQPTEEELAIESEVTA